MDGYSWTANTDGIFMDEDTQVVSSGVMRLGDYIFISEGENEMERFLTDLAVDLKLDREEVDVIRAITKYPDWQKRYAMYRLADDIQLNDLTPETLGYREEED